MDVTSLLSVPVWIMEPMTILQKAAEIMEYTDLLDKANSCSEEYERYALSFALYHLEVVLKYFYLQVCMGSGVCDFSIWGFRASLEAL